MQLVNTDSFYFTSFSSFRHPSVDRLTYYQYNFE